MGRWSALGRKDPGRGPGLEPGFATMDVHETTIASNCKAAWR